MKRPCFAMLMCSMVLVWGGNDPTTSYAMEGEVGAEGTSKASREDAWRAEFLARVEKVDNISQLKEELIGAYQTLSKEQDRREQRIVELRSQRHKGDLGFSELRRNSRNISQVRRLDLQIGYYEASKIYLVRRYKLILSKEQLSTSNKNQKMSESEYGKKMREIDQALFRLEHLHEIEIGTNRIILALHDLESALKQ